MECTYWKYNSNRHIGKGLALLKKGKGWVLKGSIWLFIVIGIYNTTFALIVDYISWYKMKGGVHSLLKTKMVEAVWVASTIYNYYIFSKAIDYLTNASSSFVLYLDL